MNRGAIGSPNDTRWSAVERLARLVLKGDVVFFIGAGLSVDSEGNTALRLMTRLFIRMLGFSHAVRIVSKGELEREGNSAIDALWSTFQLTGPRPKTEWIEQSKGSYLLLKSDLRKLSERYYEANEWFCATWRNLLAVSYRQWKDALEPLLGEVERIEEQIRAHAILVDDDKATEALGFRDCLQFQPPPLDPVSLRRPGGSHLFHPALFGHAASPDELEAKAAGKTLFLDTMGFCDSRVMGGRPNAESLDDVAGSYVGKLLPRHHVLARLAREGVCTTLISANYDLLIEGALRLTGLGEQAPLPGFPATTISRFARITNAREFFTRGKDYRTAVLMKMHGCAQRYRDLVDAMTNLQTDGGQRRSTVARDSGRGTPKVDVGPWTDLCHYLRAMVFTYREIQNWREDFWAADHLRDLMRTRTVVFCGYSLQDPVLHDTFRTVYEEMARSHRRDSIPGTTRRSSTPGEAGPSPRTEDAPAFFFAPGSEERREFHGIAVLQAASCAVGAPEASYGNHPNYLRFHYRSEPEFPNLDEFFGWLFHLFWRFRQQECLTSDLRRTALALLGRAGGRQRPGIADAEFRTVQDDFDRLVRAELSAAANWNAPPKALDRHREARAAHREICAWTDSFHLGLLREFAAGEVVHRRQGPGRELAALRRHPWYYPAMQDGGWTAWGAVVELALRRMVGQLHATDDPMISCPPCIRVGRCQQPTVLFTPQKSGRSAPVALTIQQGGFQRADRLGRVQGHPIRRGIWQLDPEDSPWPMATPTSPAPPSGKGRIFRQPVVLQAPPADVIWRWASCVDRPEDEAQLGRWLCIDDPEPPSGLD